MPLKEAFVLCPAALFLMGSCLLLFTLLLICQLQIQLYNKGGTLSLAACNLNGSAHLVDNGFGNGKPKSGSLGGIGHAVILPGKWLKQLFQELFRHTDPIILYHKGISGFSLHKMAFLGYLHQNLSVFRGILHSI